LHVINVYTNTLYLKGLHITHNRPPISIQNAYINLKLDYTIDKLDLGHDYDNRCKFYWRQEYGRCNSYLRSRYVRILSFQYQIIPLNCIMLCFTIICDSSTVNSSITLIIVKILKTDVHLKKIYLSNG